MALAGGFTYLILAKLGAKGIYTPSDLQEPTTEEQFNALTFINTTPPITWDTYQSARANILNEYGLIEVRKYRDRLLSACDWIMTTDNVDTIQNIDDWKSYRQQLRDITQTIVLIWLPNSTSLDFKNMTFPVKPPVIRKPT